MIGMIGHTNKWAIISFLFLACIAITSVELRAQAIVAPSGRTIFSRATLIRSFVEVRRSSLDMDATSTDITQYITPLAVVYGVRPNWTAIVAQPYVTMDVTRESRGEKTKKTSSGLGDTQFFLQYDGIYKRNEPGGLTRVAGVFGVQAPTGDDRFSTGAFAYTGGLIFEKASTLRYAFTADFQYTFATENGQVTSVGDQARFDAAPAYFLISRNNAGPDAPFFRKLYDRVFRNGAYLILELNGVWEGRARSHGMDIANTGGTVLSVSPGVQLFPTQSFVIEVSVPLPVVTARNGIQPDPRPNVLIGFRYLF